MNTARDEYLVFNDDRCIRAFTSDGVKAAMADIGKYAEVKRITTDELARIVTNRFTPQVPDEYPDDEVADRRHRRERSHAFAFGQRRL